MGYILNQKSKAKTLDTLILQIYHFFTSFGSVLRLNIIAKVRFLHTKKRDCHHYDDNPVYTNYLLSHVSFQIPDRRLWCRCGLAFAC